MTKYKEIFENNREWIASMEKLNIDFFKNLSKDQRPDYLYIGCSDSRVSANEIMGLEPGEVFVHRNIANLVHTTDLNAISVIHYAVKYLEVKHIVVCGHYNCGGVKFAMQQKDHGILNPWLRNIRDVFRDHKDELFRISDEDLRYDRLVEMNVLEQCLNVLKLSSVQQSIISGGYPQVHACVFDIKTGLLKDLNLDYMHTLHEIQEIYNLSDSGSIEGL
jgi:carbonic anhydrase